MGFIIFLLNQNVQDFQKAVDGLYIVKNVDVYITGSNAHLLSGELATLQEINDHYPKFILTMDIDPIADFDGIKKINVLDWLVE